VGVVVCAVIACSGAYGGSWSENSPVVERDGNNIGNTMDISWELWTSESGSQAYAEMWPIDTEEETYQGESETISCSRKLGFVWTTCEEEDPEEQTFTLTWAGNVSSNICTVTAEDEDDFGKSTELGFAKVTSGDFGDGDADKWWGQSEKGAELPSNPDEDKEGRRSQAGTITVNAGLPPSITGTLKWEFFAAGGGERSASGAEASSAVSVGASSATFDHPGGGTNTEVSATAHHTATVSF